MATIEDEVQKKIFAKNLNKHIAQNRKMQIDVAKDLDINATTLNMWCKGKSMPGTGTIRRLADYFGIGMTDLTDEKPADVETNFSKVAMNIGLHDERFSKLVIRYSELPIDKKNVLCDFLETFMH